MKVFGAAALPDAPMQFTISTPNSFTFSIKAHLSKCLPTLHTPKFFTCWRPKTVHQCVNAWLSRGMRPDGPQKTSPFRHLKLVHLRFERATVATRSPKSLHLSATQICSLQALLGMCPKFLHPTPKSTTLWPQRYSPIPQIHTPTPLNAFTNAPTAFTFSARNT